MASLDIFSQNAFSMTSLTAAINAAPYKPGMLGKLGIFKEVPIRTTVAFVERRGNSLQILPTATRGTLGDGAAVDKRYAFPINVPHVPHFRTIKADDVQNVRAFGTEEELAAVGQLVNDTLTSMNNDHAATHEYHRLGAVKGQVLDADGSSVVVDLTAVFGISPQITNWAAADADFAPKCVAIHRQIANALGNRMHTGVVALCGDGYFDGIVKHSSTKTAWERWNNGEFLRKAQLGEQFGGSLVGRGFEYQDIVFINYRGVVGSAPFVATNDAYCIPLGVDDLFQEIIAPGDTVETVNTRGKRFYAFQERLPFGKGVKLHTQSNVLPICTQLDAIVKSTYTP